MNDHQLMRYSRQIMLPDFDYDGQQCLLDSKILIVGMGGLGCPAAMYLAASGVGELWLADFDKVELSNLQRQIAHGDADIGRSKVDSVSDELKRLNPGIRLHPIHQKLSEKLMHDTVAQVDVVVDCSDNFPTRFELNRACVSHNKPLVSGAAIRGEGQIIVFDSRDESSPCYRCLYKEELDEGQLSCSDSGVIAPLVGVIGAMQALQAIKVLTDFGATDVGRLMLFDAKFMEWRKLTVSKNTACPVCSDTNS